MYSKILFLVKYYLLWIGLSVLAKILFLLFHADVSLTFSDYFNIFYKGLRMDLSIGAYITMLAAVVMAFTPYVPGRIIKKVYTYLSVTLFAAFWFIILADLELFGHWGYHIDATPLLYIKTPQAAFASVSYGRIFLYIVFFFILIYASYWVYKRVVLRNLNYQTNIRYWGQSLVCLIIGGAMVIPIRGGLNLAPLNVSFVFFHKTNMLANQAAINPMWNFLYEATHMNNVKHEYQFMEQDKAQQIVDSLHRTQLPPIEILNNKQPNVVVLLLESFTADAIEVLGGEKGVTPNLNQLAEEGVLFTNVYASGNRSDKGITAAIGALPAHPNQTVIKYPNKIARFTSFPKDFEEAGYHTKFYYAGDINFGGFRSYVTMNFQDMVTEDNFGSAAREKSFKWGIHDEFMFDYLYEDIKKAPQPFMYMAFTMSSHEPFEVPMETVIQGESESKRFLNSIYYTDKCIGDFVQKLKADGLWENTLLLMIADHGTIKIRKREAYESEAFHIPLIFTGGAVSTRGLRIETIGSQTDMIATLFGQLDIKSSEYKFSKNLLAEDVIPFAYYAYSNAIGMIREEGVSTYNLKAKRFITGDSLNVNNEWMQAYLQVWDKDLK
ncbi:sulfatase-like hydrolase/transferase [Odoribacter sp. OttesenSCG-928-G04]|nr:sulfatase-like hydrolase/transferase [Odoribacter sp. OttesenSCG-928-G04]